MMKLINTSLFLLVILLTSACSTTPLTPSQVAQHFWSAVLVEDEDAAKQYTRPTAAQENNALPADVQGATVKFGEVRIKSDQAAIDTTLEFKNSPSQRTANFVTYLARESSQWRVDLLETRQSLQKSMERRGLDKLVDDLRNLGQDFSSQIESARKNWEKSQPEIKKDLEELGQSVQEQVEDAIDKLGPEIERNVLDLQESIDKALKELERSLPENKPQPDPKIEPEGRMI